LSHRTAKTITHTVIDHNWKQSKLIENNSSSASTENLSTLL